MELGVQTKYILEIIDAKSKIVKKKVMFHNVITNWSVNTGFSSAINRIKIGKGTGAPSAEDTRLFSELGEKVITYSNLVSDFKRGVSSSEFVVNILETEFNGNILTEIGLHTYAHGMLLTHAMLPEPIMKTNLDIIKITIICASTFDSDFAALAGTVKFLSSIVLGMTRFYNEMVESFYGEGVNASYLKLTDAVKATKTTNKNIHTFALRFSSALNNLNSSITGITKIYSASLVLYPVCSEWFDGTMVFDELLITDGIKKDFSLRWGLVESIELKREDGTVIQANEYTVDLMKLKTVDKSLAYFLLPRESNTFTHDKSFLECKDSIAKELSLINIGEGVYQKFYNPAYRYGIDKLFIRGNARVEGYMESEGKWYVLGTFANIQEKEFIVPEKLRNCSIWKFTQLDTKGIRINPISEIHSEYAPIHFINPPAAGEKIYANYKTKYIAKTTNNTYDLTQTFTFGQGQGSNPQIDITELFVNPTSVDLKVDETVVLEVSYKPADAVNDITYTSDNPSVAVFEQGAIRAVGVGTCTCKVKSKNVYQDILVTVKEAS